MTHWTTTLLTALLCVGILVGCWIALPRVVADGLCRACSRYRGLLRKDPIGAAIMMLFAAGMVAYGGGKGPIIRPPIIIHRIIIWQDPMRILRPIWSRYHRQQIEQPPLNPGEP